MVLPTRGQQLAKQVRDSRGDIYIHGIEMGGNPLSAALKEKIKAGNQVFITPEGASTINYNINKVREKGFTIVSEKELEGANTDGSLKIHTVDLDPNALNNFLMNNYIPQDFDIIAVAVQDHGKSEGSSTNFRGQWIQAQLKKAPKLDSFLFSEKEIPSFLLRMNTIITYLRKFYPKSRLYVMDTVFAAIQGATYSQSIGPNVISMDIGNGHTAAVSRKGDEIYGYFEFHTSAITPSKLEWAIEKLIDGKLTNEEIWSEGGHGALTRKPLAPPLDLYITGPHRRFITQTKLEYHFANPLGDMMITGCVGLALGIERREKIRILDSI